MQPPKTFPRFFPTLTEVVQPGAPAPVSPAVQAPVTSAADRELLVEQVLQRIAPVVEERLHEAVHAMLQDQMDLLARRLHQEIESTVRQAVIQATAENLPKT